MDSKELSGTIQWLQYHTMEPIMQCDCGDNYDNKNYAKMMCVNTNDRLS